MRLCCVVIVVIGRIDWILYSYKKQCPLKKQQYHHKESTLMVKHLLYVQYVYVYIYIYIITAYCAFCSGGVWVSVCVFVYVCGNFSILPARGLKMKCRIKYI